MESQVRYKCSTKGTLAITYRKITSSETNFQGTLENTSGYTSSAILYRMKHKWPLDRGILSRSIKGYTYTVSRSWIKLRTALYGYL